MGPDGWVEWTSNKGDKHLTYDSEINTKEEAIRKGHTNVNSVSKSGNLYHNNENLDLNEDGTIVNKSGGTFGGDIDDMSFRTSDNVWVSENKGIVDGFGDFLPEGLSKVGEVTSTAAVPLSLLPGGQPVSAALLSIGGAFGTAGTSLEMINDLFEGKFSLSKFSQKLGFYMIGTQVPNITNNGAEEALLNEALGKADSAIDNYRKNKEK